MGLETEDQPATLLPVDHITSYNRQSVIISPEMEFGSVPVQVGIFSSNQPYNLRRQKARLSTRQAYHRKGKSNIPGYFREILYNVNPDELRYHFPRPTFSLTPVVSQSI